MPTVVEENLTGNVPIVIANTSLKTMQIFPRTNVGKAVVLSVKGHIKYQDKKGLIRDVGPMEKEVIKAPRAYKSQGIQLLEVNKGVIA